MKEEEKITDRFGKEGPWKVPEGYFDSVRVEILDKLPPYKEAPKEERHSVWTRVRPYLYLAAMFAGIWCMMKVFHHASGMDSLSLDNPPEHIAAYMGDPDVAEPFLIPASISDEELLDEVSDSYSSMEDFEEDFGYTLTPQYQSIDVDPQN